MPICRQCLQILVIPCIEHQQVALILESQLMAQAAIEQISPFGPPEAATNTPLQNGQPAGFHRNLVSPLAWGPDEAAAASGDVKVDLNPDEITEIQRALVSFRGKKSGPDMHALSPESFPLPTLGPRLRELAKELHQGLGFFTLRGLEPKIFSSIDNMTIHVGIASYIGDKRAMQQNYYSSEGEALLHVCDVKQKIENIQEDVFLAPGNESIAVGFHSDNGDNVSLYCWQTSVEGGELYLCSAWKVYNELASRYPRVLHILADIWLWQDSKTGEKELRSHLAPLIHFVDGKLVVNYQKRPLRGTKQEPRDPRLTPLSREQEAALNIMDRVAAEFAISLDQRPGDMHFFNNLALLHARSAFRDGPEEAIQRHLTRIIFRNSELGWKIPDPMLPDWEKYYNHSRENEVFPEKPHPWAFSLCGHD
ncbi:hypothetical protein CDV36_000364 [Fusarium kuroshium]|uniref:TauD/TfdA-like domain-containing protein n=1 Tax=Fusarium kuroshium TaxID=2010991 RepID=A0A3M2SR04_9HYPO|nr:hypothetical protein CDV36_000364 [Fusarium kuroshium]